MKYDHLYRFDKPDIKKEAIRGATLTVSVKILSYIFQTVATIVLARLLIPEDFGLVAMVTVFSNILVEFGMLRLSDAIVQKDVITHSQISTLFWINVAMCGLVAFAFVLFSPVLEYFYSEPKIKPIVVVVALSFIFSGLSNQHIALMQRNMLFWKLGVLQIVAIILTDVVAIVMAWKGFGYWAIVTRRIGQPFFLTIGAWIAFRWRPGLPVKDCGVGPLIKYGINSLGSYTTNYFSRSFDKFVIGWKNGPLQLGYYDRAYYLFVMPVNQVTYPLTSVAVAGLSRLVDDRDKFRKYYYKALLALSFLGMPLSGFLTVAGKDIVRILLGPKWEMAGILFTVLSPSIGVMLLYGTNNWLHLSLGRTNLMFKWGVFSLIFTSILIFIAAHYGTIFVAAAYSVTFYVLLFPGIWYSGRAIDIDMRIIFNLIWPSFIISLITGMITWLSSKNLSVTYFINTEINLLVKTLVVFCVYAAVYTIIIFVIYKRNNPIMTIARLFRYGINGSEVA